MPALQVFRARTTDMSRPGITWSSTNAFNQGGSVFGLHRLYGYSFLANGILDAGIGPMAGVER